MSAGMISKADARAAVTRASFRIDDAVSTEWEDGHLFGHPVKVVTPKGKTYHFHGVRT